MTTADVSGRQSDYRAVATRLGDLEEIRELKARYIRLLDTKQWAAWRALFTDDVVFDRMRVAASGPDDFVRKVAQMLNRGTSVHRCHTSEIVFFDATTARGIWSMSDFLEYPADGETWGFRGHGYYEEEYRLTDDGWRISLLRLARLRVDPLPEGQGFPEPQMVEPSPDWLTVPSAD